MICYDMRRAERPQFSMSHTTFIAVVLHRCTFDIAALDTFMYPVVEALFTDAHVWCAHAQSPNELQSVETPSEHAARSSCHHPPTRTANHNQPTPSVHAALILPQSAPNRAAG